MPPIRRASYLPADTAAAAKLLAKMQKKYVVEPNGCWRWIGGLTHLGYGRVNFGNKAWVAHRMMGALLVEDVAPELDLDHLCRNRPCINPDHMEPVPRQVNLMRGDTIVARQARQTHCKNGHEFTPENTYVRVCGRRRCQTCERMFQERRRQRRLAS